MSDRPPGDAPAISPTLFYRDALAAIDFLREAFGFRDVIVVPGGEGEVVHAELELNGGIIMLGTVGADDFCPSKAPELRVPGPTVYVADPDAHSERARAAGATITAEPEDKSYGARGYSARDPEGYEWWFGNYVAGTGE